LAWLAIIHRRDQIATLKVALAAITYTWAERYHACRPDAERRYLAACLDP
jgi:hypothetical protein